MSTQATNNEVALITLALPNPHEQEAMGQYAQGSFQVAGQYGAKIVARFGVTEQLHGDNPTAIIGVAVFPDADTIKEMFNSEAYQQLVPLRDKAITSLNVYISQPNQSVAIETNADRAYLLTMAVPNMGAQEVLGQYQKGAGPIGSQYGVKPLANIRIAETFLGDQPAAFLSIAESPNNEAITGFFSDDAYQSLIPHRDQALRSLNLYIAKPVG